MKWISSWGRNCWFSLALASHTRSHAIQFNRRQRRRKKKFISADNGVRFQLELISKAERHLLGANVFYLHTHTHTPRSIQRTRHRRLLSITHSTRPANRRIRFMHTPRRHTCQRTYSGYTLWNIRNIYWKVNFSKSNRLIVISLWYCAYYYSCAAYARRRRNIWKEKYDSPFHANPKWNLNFRTISFEIKSIFDDIGGCELWAFVRRHHTRRACRCDAYIYEL